LRLNDVDFASGTIRVDEVICKRTYTIEPCKNGAACRNIALDDPEGKEALEMLRQFLGDTSKTSLSASVFRSRRGTPLRETDVIADGLHPALKAVGFPQAGMHAFRRGCNRRWELAGNNRAIIRQQMGHSSETMTVHYTDEIPLEELRIVTRRSLRRLRKVIESVHLEAGRA